jgi:diadenylate cyclase
LIPKSIRHVVTQLAPGTPLHEGIEFILRARTGALIVLGDSPEVMELTKGGFKIDAPYLPNSIYELAKMDGAIILSDALDRIMYANVHLFPSPDIPTNETGTRHASAERMSRATGKPVVAISSRRNVITIYFNKYKYIMRDIGYSLNMANQALQTLARYREVLEKAVFQLNTFEFEDDVTVADVAECIRRWELTRRVAEEVTSYIIELGAEGRLIKMQMQELIRGRREEAEDILKDYMEESEHKQPWKLLNVMEEWDLEDVLEPGIIEKAVRRLGEAGIETEVVARGYRTVSRIAARMPEQVVENLIESFGSISKLLKASVDELDEVEGIGKSRAVTLFEGLKRIKDQVSSS